MQKVKAKKEGKKKSIDYIAERNENVRYFH